MHLVRARRTIAALIVAAGASVLVCPAQAQETVNLASVSGRVSDTQGAVVPGALVVARQTDTNVKLTTVTDRDGRFRFPYLRVGTYEVTVHLDGFADAKRSATVTVGSAFDLPFTLAPAGVESHVTVSGEPPVLETARTQIASTVSAVETQDLPLNGRNFLDLALLAPGVSPTNIGSTQTFAETSAVPGPGLSVGSQRNFSNSFIVDGLSANDDAAGLSGIPYGVDAVDQFQVVTSGGQAELGRALGGYVNIVTRSGTNTPSGDAYGYFRDDRFNARNVLFPTKLPMHQNQFGGSFGGPLRRDRSFFFTNVERRQLDQSGLTTISQANVQTINTKLAAAGYPGPLVTTGVYPNPVRTTNLLAKVDSQANARNQLSFRYGEYDATASNSRGAGGLGAPSASAGLDNVDRAVAVNYTASLSDRTVNEFRAQFAYGDLKASPTDAVGPAVTIAGVATFGTLSGAPTRRLNRMYELVDNLSRQAGAHALRAGVDVLYNADAITFPRANRGAYSFSSLANFLTGIYNNTGFTQTFGVADVSQNNPNVGVYLQDEWTARPDLTVNAGVRYDLQFLQTVRTDRDNVSPRLGFAWSPAVLGHTVVRGSAGLFYDRVPLRAVANALLSAGNTTNLANLRQNNVSLSPGQTGAPSFPNILTAAVASGTLPNLTTMDPHMRNAYSAQGSIEVEHQVAAGMTISAGYQYVRGRELIIQVNQNVPACVASGGNNGCRPNPAFANNAQYSPLASSIYHGLHLSLIRRPSAWGYYRVSYTLSKAMDNVGEAFFSSPIDPFDLSKDWGRSDDDQRHRFVVTGAVNARGFQVSSQVQVYSALPFNITSGVTTLQGTAGRPLVNGAFIPRNAGIGPDFFSLNLRLRRSFDLGRFVRADVLVEGFNLTNHTNVVTLNGNFGAGAFPANPSSTFGQPTGMAEPRSAQLGFRVHFQNRRP